MLRVARAPYSCVMLKAGISFMVGNIMLPAKTLLYELSGMCIWRPMMVTGMDTGERPSLL